MGHLHPVLSPGALAQDHLSGVTVVPLPKLPFYPLSVLLTSVWYQPLRPHSCIPKPHQVSMARADISRHVWQEGSLHKNLCLPEKLQDKASKSLWDYQLLVALAGEFHQAHIHLQLLRTPRQWQFWKCEEAIQGWVSPSVLPQVILSRLSGNTHLAASKQVDMTVCVQMSESILFQNAKSLLLALNFTTLLWFVYSVCNSGIVMLRMFQGVCLPTV